MLGVVLALGLAGCANLNLEQPAIAVIIDDLGNQAKIDHRALALEGLKSVAILPFGPLSHGLAKHAHESGIEVLLHLPMEAEHKNHLLGPGALRTHMAYDEFVNTVRNALDDIPHRSGVTNHMGSRLTRDPQRMAWLMEELSNEPSLLYVDSRTTSNSAARGAARQAKVRYLARDIFLDNQRDIASINARFDELVQRAEQRGHATGIAHPYEETLQVLAERLRRSDQFRVVTVEELVRVRECRQADPD